jgi:hypothetical protein
MSSRATAFAHQRATEQNPGAFFSDIQLAKIVLEDLTGVEVSGYRAPSFSIGPAIRGRSSASSGPAIATARASTRSATITTACPMRRASRTTCAKAARGSGDDDAPLRPQLAGGGGGYFRLLPYATSRWLLRRVNRVDRQPAIFYFHPWEIDPAQPRVPESTPRRDSATISTWIGWSDGCASSCSISNGVASTW